MLTDHYLAASITRVESCTWYQLRVLAITSTEKCRFLKRSFERTSNPTPLSTSIVYQKDITTSSIIEEWIRLASTSNCVTEYLLSWESAINSVFLDKYRHYYFQDKCQYWWCEIILGLYQFFYKIHIVLNLNIYSVRILYSPTSTEHSHLWLMHISQSPASMVDLLCRLESFPLLQIKKNILFTNEQNLQI